MTSRKLEEIYADILKMSPPERLRMAAELIEQDHASMQGLGWTIAVRTVEERRAALTTARIERIEGKREAKQP